MDKPNRKDLAHLTKMLIEEGRHGGPEAVRQFSDHGEFDLVHYVDTFRPGWRLAVFRPIVYRRHMLWRRLSCQLTPGTPEFWDLLLKEEHNLAAAEFGQLSIDFAERARLRIIRQSHGMEWWAFR